MNAHQVFPLDDKLKTSGYHHDRGALESMATSVGASRYVYFVHRKTVIPRVPRVVLTVYDLWTGSNREYTTRFNRGEELREFYELDADEGIAIVENQHELLVVHTRLVHKTNELVESENGFTLLACIQTGIRVLELQFNKKFLDIARTDIIYDGDYYFLYTDPWREGDIIYCFESEPIPGTEDDRSFNGSLFSIDLKQKEIRSIPPQFPFAPAMSSGNGKGTVHVVGVFHRPGHLWVVTQNSKQIAVLSVWRLDDDGWHAITTVNNDEYEVTMDVCTDGSAMVVLEDEVNGSPIMRNIRHKGIPTLFSLARTATLKHLPGLRCDSYFTQMFSRRLFK
ncbi:unnamed protein product [Nippostrongylus brasiliensis]|uniref:DUF4915 domain-containing protein n=1 Tax=Nippostrongylus brasiliensis TaxID=27835 RepID=A0A0N4YL50_NIPBR|nr:unnamed protein product [Nippostrongylus brasiliensis]